MRTGWGDRELDLPRQPVADRAAVRRAKLAGMFPGERLVLPAGTFKVRANDTDYKFRPDTAHTYFSGNQTSDAVLVVEDGEAVLYARPALRARHRRVLPRPPVRRAVGRPPSVAARALRLARHRVPPHRPAPGRAHVHRPRRRPGCCAASRPRWTGWSPPTTPSTRTCSAWSASCGWSRTTGRSPSSRRPATSPRSASRTRCASGRRSSSSASAGSRAPSTAGPAPWATTSATTRSSAAAATPRRCTGSTTPARSRPASWCCSTWASRAATSTPPT